ncbi:MAG: hypothetical protein U0525_01265 [Patescibacteria group bacterium]
MKYAINLFPSKKSVFTVLSNFMVYYLRYALVLTLFVVVVIFFLRMKLDQTLIEEQSKMSQKKAIVKATEGIRSDLQAIQKKVRDINEILSSQDKIIEIINYVTGVVPQGMDVQTIDIRSEGATFNATTVEYRKIQSLQKRLQKEARFEKINIGGVARDKVGIYSLSVTLEGWKGVSADAKVSETPSPTVAAE